MYLKYLVIRVKKVSSCSILKADKVARSALWNVSVGYVLWGSRAVRIRQVLRSFLHFCHAGHRWTAYENFMKCIPKCFASLDEL